MASQPPPVQFIASTATLGAFSTTTISITASAYRSFNTPAISVPFPTGYGTRQVQLAYSWTATPTGRGQATSTIGGRPATSGLASVLREPTRAAGAGTSGGGSGGGGGGFQWPTWATGVVAGCGGLALIVLVLALICWRRRAKRKQLARARAASMSKRGSRRNVPPMSEKNGRDRQRLNKAHAKGARNGAAAFAPLHHQSGHDEASFDNNYPPRPTPPPAAAATDYRSGSPFRPMDPGPTSQPYADPRYASIAPGYHTPPRRTDPYGQPIGGHYRTDSAGSIDSGYDTPRRGADMSSASVNGSPARLIPNAAPMPVRPPASRWNVAPEADHGASVGAAMLSDDDDDVEPSPINAAGPIGQARGGTPVEEGARQGSRPGRHEIEAAPLAYPSLPRDDVRNRRSVHGGVPFQDSSSGSPTRAGRADSRQRQRNDSSQSHYHEARSGSALSNHSDPRRSIDGRRSTERPGSSHSERTPGYDSASAQVPGSPGM